MPAIEELTARGINVNVTLLFSVARYEQVIDAYLTGLERRARRGDPIDAIASVASFFVSRVDAKTDAMLPAGSDLRGRVAIANARLAYARYRDRFSDPRWLALREAGAQASATAVGEHRHQGPRLLRRALRRGADRPGRHQHHARGHPARLRRPRRRHPRLRSELHGGRRDAPTRRGRRHRPRRRHGRARAAKASAPSATPTATCSPASRPSSRAPSTTRRGSWSADDRAPCARDAAQTPWLWPAVASNVSVMTDRLAIERWIDEGGQPRSRSRDRARAACLRSSSRARACRPRVLIAGGGVAGLETLLALRALAGDRVDITLVTPELRFVNRSMAVDQPFRPQRARGVRMRGRRGASTAPRWHRGALDRVEHDRRVVVTKDGDELPYDMLVLALGARPDREWHVGRRADLPRRPRRPRLPPAAPPAPRGPRQQAGLRQADRASWPLPLYDLALMTAADCRSPSAARSS